MPLPHHTLAPLPPAPTNHYAAPGHPHHHPHPPYAHAPHHYASSQDGTGFSRPPSGPANGAASSFVSLSPSSTETAMTTPTLSSTYAKRCPSPPSSLFASPPEEGMQSVRPVPSKPPPRKRNRLALSCTHCRDRKIRCSREIPCEQCIKRGDEDSCRVEHFKHRAAEERAFREREETAAEVRAQSEQEIQALQDRIEQLELERRAERSRADHLQAALQEAQARSAMDTQRPGEMAREYAQMQVRMHGLEAHLASRSTSPSVDRPLPPSVRHYTAADDPAEAQPATDAENAVAMLETLVNLPPVSAPMPKGQSRMADRMAVSRLVHSHNTADKARSLRCGSTPTPRRIVPDPALPLPQQSMERPYPPISNPAHAHADMASDSTLPAWDASDDTSTPPSVLSAHSATSTRSSTGSPPGDASPKADKPGVADLTAILGAKHTGLLKVYNGSETKLGFGIGWTFAAAAERGEYEEIRQACEGTSEPLEDGHAEREAIFRTVLRTLPSREVMYDLFASYEQRANFIHTRAVHVGQLKRELDTVLACPDEASRAHVLHELDPGWLALLLMVLVLGLKFYPCPDAERNDQKLSVGLLNASCTMNCWYSSAKTIVAILHYGVTNPTLSLIQAMLCIDLHGAEDESTMQFLQKAAQHSARVLGIDRLGGRPTPKPGSGEESEQELMMRYEMSKRVWWALVSRDWYASQIAGLLYNIIPDQFSTPKPGNYNDADLELMVVPPPRPNDEYTDSSYALARAALGNTIRKHTDVINRRAAEQGINAFLVRLSPEDVNHLDASYRALLEVEFPIFYRMKNPTTPRASVDMERALLHNIIFSQLLRLHRFSLSSRPDEAMNGVGGRDTCVLLARSMLNALGTLQQGMSAIGRLWCLRGHLFQASAVLVLDLCRRPQLRSDRAQIRKQVMTAVMALRFVLHYNPPVKRSLRILLALLAEEDQQWRQRELAAPGPGAVPPLPSSHNMVALASRIKGVISAHHNAELTPGESNEMEKAVAYVSSTAAADLADTSSPPAPTASAGAGWFTLPTNFGAEVPFLGSEGGTNIPVSFLPGGMSAMGLRPSKNLLPPMTAASLGVHPPAAAAGRDQPSCPPSYPPSATHMLFRPGEGAPPALGPAGYASCIPDPALVSSGDDFSLAAFVSQHSARLPGRGPASGAASAAGSGSSSAHTSDDLMAPLKLDLSQHGPAPRPAPLAPHAAAHTAEHHEENTSIDAFFRWVLDQGQSCPKMG